LVRRWDYVGYQSQVVQWHGGYLELQMRNAAMTKLAKASFVAIGRQLRDDYSSRMAEPLPSEIKGLVAQLVTFEFSKRSNERLAEVLQPAIVQPGPYAK
jgi:hypothetical protein